MPKGDIGSIIETKDIVSNNLGDTFNCIKLADGYYMMAFKDNDLDGHIVTFAITESDGNIGGTISNWEFLNNTTTGAITLIKISGTTYAIVYSAWTAQEFYVRTFTVSDVGVITQSFIDTLIIPVTNTVPNLIRGSDIINISGDIYAIVFIESGGSAPGKVVTVDINSAGVISNAVLDTLEFVSSAKYGVSIVQVGATDFWAIAFADSGSDPTVVTVDIDSAGTIAASVTDTQELAVTNLNDMGNIMRVPGTNYYAVVTSAAGSNGRIYTCSINSSGAITNGSQGNFDSSDAEHPHIISLGGDAFLVAYRGVDNDGFLISITIDSAGAVGSVIESLEFKTNDARTPFIIYLGYGNYAITYGAEAEDDVECITVGVVTGAIFPTQAITRVTNLIHRYNRKEGIYELEMSLGEVTSDFGLPEWLSSPRTLAAKLEREQLESLIAKKVRESLTGSQLWPGEVPPGGGIGPRPIDPAQRRRELEGSELFPGEVPPGFTMPPRPKTVSELGRQFIFPGFTRPGEPQISDKVTEQRPVTLVKPGILDKAARMFREQRKKFTWLDPFS